MIYLLRTTEHSTYDKIEVAVRRLKRGVELMYQIVGRTTKHSSYDKSQAQYIVAQAWIQTELQNSLNVQ